MGKDPEKIDILKPGALIKFGDGKYGFMRGEEVEKVDERTISVDGHEISAVLVKYLNNPKLPSIEGMEEKAEMARKGLGRAVRKRRKELGMEQKDFHVSQATISDIELGNKMSRYLTLKRIAESMDMTFPELMSLASLEMWREDDE